MRGVIGRGQDTGHPARRLGGRLKRAALLSLAVLLPVGMPVVGPDAPASARFDPAFGFDFWVESPEMGPIKSRIFRAADGNTGRVVYALDGMRARDDLSGWEIDTDVARELTKWNINVVMPVGGRSSFYADWNAPSNFFGLGSSGSAGGATGSAADSGSGLASGSAAGLGRSNTYKWESFLTRDLRWALRDRLGFNPNGNGVFGLSMGGSAALALAAYHPDQFRYAASYSGYLNVSAPGMREALRVAMLDAGGFNIDAMAPPWSPQWLRMDPFVFAPLLRAHNTRLWISAGSGLPAAADGLDVNTVNAMGLEALALVNTRAFQARMMSLGAGNVTYDFPAVGVHNWRYWTDEVYRMIPDLSANIG